jgi:chemotaxis protein CheX
VTETLQVDHDLVLTVVDQVWETLLASPAIPWPGAEPSDPGGLLAQIALTGDWNGVVRLTCDDATAERIAGRMLQVRDGEELLTEDVHDAIGEVVNVVGGNVKGALGGDTSLGLPQVQPGPPTASPATATRCVLDWEGSPVVVEVLLAAPATA